jgi:hypothetical protein
MAVSLLVSSVITHKDVFLSDIPWLLSRYVNNRAQPGLIDPDFGDQSILPVTSETPMRRWPSTEPRLVSPGVISGGRYLGRPTVPAAADSGIRPMAM